MIPPASGLPAYTLPPSGASADPYPPSANRPEASQAPTDWFPSKPRPEPAAREMSSPSASRPVSGPTPSRPDPNTPHEQSAGSYGVRASDGPLQPFGGPTAQVSTPPTRPGTYGSEPAAAVPQQRGLGTVYGGAGPERAPYGGIAAESAIDMTMPVNMNAVENSGSLTGHILAQGWDYGSDDNRRSNVKIGIAMLIVLVILVGVSLVFLLTAGSAFSTMVHSVFK